MRGDDTEVKGRRLDIVVTKDGKPFRNEQSVAFTLRRHPAGRVIAAVN